MTDWESNSALREFGTLRVLDDADDVPPGGVEVAAAEVGPAEAVLAVGVGQRRGVLDVVVALRTAVVLAPPNAESVAVATR